MTKPAGRDGTALRTERLFKSFGTMRAVCDVSLEVQVGETVALLGPSGCGKSTVLRCVAGLETPDSGRVVVGGRDVTALPPEDRQLGLVFQDYALFPHLSVLDNVAYGPRRRGLGREAVTRALAALERVGLAELAHRRPAELSGGQQQRVALARVLATEAPLLLLDEPLSNLDEKLRADLRRDLRGMFAGLGAGVLLVTHDQREALALARRVIVMRDGQLVQQGPAHAVFERPASAWVAQFLGWHNILPLDGSALLVPEQAVRLGQGEPLTVISRQPAEHGEQVTVSHPLGPLVLHLSPREAAGVGASLQLELLPQKLLRVPEDRSPHLGGPGTL